MHQKRVRYFLVVLGVLAIVGGLAAVKTGQISMLINAGKAAEQAGPPPEVVSTALAKEEAWESSLSAVGSVAAARGVIVSNEVPGVVVAIRFESGAQVKQGQVLLELDSSVERAQLASAEARRELARINAGRSRSLAESNSIAAAQVDNDEAVLKTSEADLSALRAQIERKTVRAPFAGRLGIRGVNLGQYLNPGTPITVLEAMDTLYVDFSVPQQRLPEVPVGAPVRVTIEGLEGGAIDGNIAAVDPRVESSTRSVKLRASLPNRREKLRPGMFANVTVLLPEQGKAVTVPLTGVVRAPYGDSVFIVEDKPDGGAKVEGSAPKVARQQFVRLGPTRGDYVALLDGVKPGQEIVVAGAFKLRNGASVVVKNDVRPESKLAPRPENR